MKQNLVLNGLKTVPVLVFGMVILLSACKENDLYDEDYAKWLYKETFPVKEIDPQQDWSTIRSVTADMRVDEDEGEYYTLKIYTGNILEEETEALLLASAEILNGKEITLSFDCPKDLETVWVSRVDKHKRRIVRPYSIEENILSVRFGSSVQTKTRGAGYNPLFDFPGIEIKNTYSPTDIDNLIANAKKDNSGKYIQFFNANQSDIREGDIYVVDQSGMIDPTRIVHGNGWQNRESVVKVIVTGANTVFTLPKESTIQAGLEIIVMNQATLKIEDDLDVNHTGAITILKGGSLAAEDIKFTGGGNFYNGGTVVMEDLTLNGGTFYNYGTFQADDLEGHNTGGKVVNRGSFILKGDLEGLYVESNCRMEVDELKPNGMLIGANSMVKCKELEAHGTGRSTEGKQVIRMEGNSMLEVTEEASFNNMGIWGPYEGSDYAYVRIHEEGDKSNYSPNVLETYILNNVYMELDKVDKYSNITHGMLNGINWGNGAWGNMNATLAKFGESPVYIPEGDCTNGNKPGEEGEDTDNEKVMYYTYAFEDNYPQPGDYDFNDIILDVSAPQRRGNKIDFYVTLQAVGATKHIGAGIRLLGKAKEYTESAELTEYDVESFLATIGGDNDLYMGATQNGLESDCGDDIVVPLFGDAHAVMGCPYRYMINTAHDEIDYTPKKVKVTLHMGQGYKTWDFSLKEHTDFFITHNEVLNAVGTSSYKRKPRVEVHLFEQRDTPTYRGLVFKENAAAAGKVTWGIMIPEFRYPLETVSIITAYSDFEKWAADMNSYKGWYKSVTSETTWR